MRNPEHRLGIMNKCANIRFDWERRQPKNPLMLEVVNFDTEMRRRNRLPHQGKRECARRAAKMK